MNPVREWNGLTLVQYPDNARFRVFEGDEYLGDMTYKDFADGSMIIRAPSRPCTLEEAINEPSSQPHPVPHRGAQ